MAFHLFPRFVAIPFLNKSFLADISVICGFISVANLIQFRKVSIHYITAHGKNASRNDRTPKQISFYSDAVTINEKTAVKAAWNVGHDHLITKVKQRVARIVL
jgi:hypothetical protein